MILQRQSATKKWCQYLNAWIELCLHQSICQARTIFLSIYFSYAGLFIWNARCFYLFDWSFSWIQVHANKAFGVEILQFNLEKFSFFVYKAVFLLHKSKISVFSSNFFIRKLTHCFVLFYPGNNDVMNVGRKVRHT